MRSIKNLVWVSLSSVRWLLVATLLALLGPSVFGGVQNLQRPNLQFTTKTRTPKIAGVPPLTGQNPNAEPIYYKKLVFSGDRQLATAPLNFRGTNSQTISQKRDKISGEINYVYNSATDAITVVNTTLIQSGSISDPPPWPADTTDWPQPPVLSVTVPVSDVGQIAASGFFVSPSNPATLTVIDGTHAGDDNVFIGSVGGINSVSAVELQNNYQMVLSDPDSAQAAEGRAKVTTNPKELNAGLRYSTRGSILDGSAWTIREVTVQSFFRSNRTCPGDYEMVRTYQKRAVGSATWLPYQELRENVRLDNGHFEKNFDLPLEPGFEVQLADMTFELVAGECGGGSCRLDGGVGGIGQGPKSGSISWQMPLGLALDGRSAGSLSLFSQHITTDLYTPASLKLAATAGLATAILDTSGGLRQVLAPQALVDIIAPSGTSYEIRVYDRANAGTPDGDGIYTPSGTPYITWRVDQPASGHWRMTRLLGTQSEITEVDESQAGTVVFSEANGLRVTTTTESTEGTNRVETIVVKDAAGTTASKRKEYFATYAWGEEKVKEVLDPDGVALTTAWTFETNSALGYYRKPLTITRPNGAQEAFAYFSDSGWLIVDDVPAWNGLLLRTEYVRTVADLDGDGVIDVRTQVAAGHGLGNLSLTHVVEWGAPAIIGGTKYTLRESRRAVSVGAAWNAASNVITYERYYAEGPYADRLAYQRNPDGTLVLHRFATATDGGTVTTDDEGTGDTSHESVADGTRTVTTFNVRGFLASQLVTDIASSRALDSVIVGQADAFGRPTHLMHLDGAEEVRSYCVSCGALEQVTLRGETTSFEFDALGRKLFETHRAGPTTLTKTRFEYDADGRLRKTYRVDPLDNTETLVASTDYDLAGRATSEFSLSSGTSTHSYAFADGHNTVVTTTYADGTTRIETHGPGNDLLKVAGTAVEPVEYYPELRTGGAGYILMERRYSDAGNLLDFRTGYNMFGEVAEKTRPGNFTARRFFDAIGRVVREVDEDGVTKLYDYDARGRQSVATVDVDVNGTIDYGGTDRITRTLATVALHGSTTVQRTTTEAWETDGTNTPTTVAVSEQSVDSLHSWQTVRGLTTETEIVYNSDGIHTITTTAPDGAVTIQTYFGDRLTATTTKDANAAQIAAVANAYDDVGRLHTTTDARNGATTYDYDSNDRLHAVTTPDPDTSRSGAGYDPQTTTYGYDAMGRITTVTQPDGGIVNTSYWPTGVVKRTWGSRTYPVEYGYDWQDRMVTMTTWQDFAGDSGKAVTTWLYDSSGFLIVKHDANGVGPIYLHKPSGRMLRRYWARGTQTFYAYNAAGDLSGTTYSDSTPAVSIDYDRMGRPKSVTDASGTRTLSYHASGQLQDQLYTAGALSGLSVSRGFDSLFRLGSVSALAGTSVLNQTGYGYDSASRLSAVTQGNNTASYGYLANSPLVSSVTFKQGGVARLTTAKSYDKLNRLSSISSAPSVGSAMSYTYDYNAANQRTKATRENNTHWDYGYDALGQVTSGKKFDAAAAAMPGNDFSWTYDDIGNRKTATVNSQLSTYTSTLLNTYSSRTIPGAFDVLAAAEPTAKVTYQYPWDTGVPTTLPGSGDLRYKQLTADNSNANVNAKVRVTGVKNLIGPNGEDAVTQITASTYLPQSPLGYTYDTDGNLTGDGKWTYTWDGENRLIAMQTTTAAGNAGVTKQKLEFGYDAQGRRFSKNVSNWDGGGWVLGTSTRFLYDNWNLLADLNALNNNAVVCSYAWGLDLSGSFQDAGGVGGLVFTGITVPSVSLHAPCYDGNGNVIAYVDMTTGIKSATYEYNAFGEALISDGIIADQLPFRFSTKYTDNESGLLYYGLRYYNSGAGRWLSRDPIEEQGGVNLYVFAANQAVSSYDLFGLKTHTFDVLTQIEGPHGLLVPQAAVGVKTDHSFTVTNDGDKVTISGEYKFFGRTFEWVPSLSDLDRTASISNSGCSDCPHLIVSMTGSAKNLANPFLGSIKYSFTFDIDTCTDETIFTGQHSGFPSFTVHAAKAAYYFHETTVGELYGKPDVSINKDFK